MLSWLDRKREIWKYLDGNHFCNPSKTSSSLCPVCMTSTSSAFKNSMYDRPQVLRALFCMANLQNPYLRPGVWRSTLESMASKFLNVTSSWLMNVWTEEMHRRQKVWNTSTRIVVQSISGQVAWRFSCQTRGMSWKPARQVKTQSILTDFNQHRVVIKITCSRPRSDRD